MTALGDAYGLLERAAKLEREANDLRAKSREYNPDSDAHEDMIRGAFARMAVALDLVREAFEMVAQADPESTSVAMTKGDS